MGKIFSLREAGPEDQEPRLNLLGATACHAANMRGVGGAQKFGVMTEGPVGEVVISCLG